jgi:hypothetical protein
MNKVKHVLDLVMRLSSEHAVIGSGQLLVCRQRRVMAELRGRHRPADQCSYEQPVSPQTPTSDTRYQKNSRLPTFGTAGVDSPEGFSQAA